MDALTHTRPTTLALPETRARGIAAIAGLSFQAALGRTGQRLAAAACSPLAISIAMFATIFALRLFVHASQSSGILLLFIAPIVLMSLAYGARVGTVGASLAVALYVLNAKIHPGTSDAISLSTRAFAFYAIPHTIWLARRDAVAAASVVEEPPSSARSLALTPREREVLALVAAGHTSNQIAERLVLSVRTIESHRASLRRKLGRPSRSDLVRHAQLLNLVPAVAPSDGVPS